MWKDNHTYHYCRFSEIKWRKDCSKRKRGQQTGTGSFVYVSELCIVPVAEGWGEHRVSNEEDESAESRAEAEAERVA